MEEQDITEPDWFQFRSDVRNAMLSRAAQRQPKAALLGLAAAAGNVLGTGRCFCRGTKCGPAALESAVEIRPP